LSGVSVFHDLQQRFKRPQLDCALCAYLITNITGIPMSKSVHPSPSMMRLSKDGRGLVVKPVKSAEVVLEVVGLLPVETLRLPSPDDEPAVCGFAVMPPMLPFESVPVPLFSEPDPGELLGDGDGVGDGDGGGGGGDVFVGSGNGCGIDKEAGPDGVVLPHVLCALMQFVKKRSSTV
jgi:hypothetical protein